MNSHWANMKQAQQQQLIGRQLPPAPSLMDGMIYIMIAYWIVEIGHHNLGLAYYYSFMFLV
jgi:hypothetical protein